MPDEASTSELSASRPPTSRTRAAPKPRAVQRKSKAEREEHARKEAERAKERETTDSTQASKPALKGGRGTNRGGRGGRGGLQSERSNVSAGTGAGVFGAGRGERPDRARGPVDVGISEALDGQGTSYDDPVRTVGNEAGVSHSGAGRSSGGGAGGGGGGGVGGAKGKASKQDEAHTLILEDEVEDLPRRDIERIWISSDEDEDAIVNRKGKQRRTSRAPKPGAGLRPVRAARTVVEDNREDAESKKRLKKTVDDSAVVDVDTDEMQLDQISGPTRRDVVANPHKSRKLSRKSDSRPKDTKPLIETVEERAERLRLYEDVDALRGAFMHKSDTDETADSKEEEAVFGRMEHNKMFLFQLPPLVPQLYNPNAKPPPEPEITEAELTEPQIKTEPGASATTAPKDGDRGKGAADTKPQILTAQSGPSQRLSSGAVGKLKIHKSGKVTLDWGGTDMEVRYGTEVDFLQDVIRVENPIIPEAEAENGPPMEYTGKAYALGQVHKKMVLIPDWSKLYA